METMDSLETELAELDPATIVTVSENDERLFAPAPAFGFTPAVGAHAFSDAGAAGGAAPVAAPPASHAPVRFKIRLANTEGRRSNASYLIEKMYSWRGYATDGVAVAPNRVTLVASDATRPVATVSVGFDSPAGLVVENVYREEVERIRTEGRKLCEFTKLAVERSSQSTEILAMLFHIAYMYARVLNGCTDTVIEVNPRHARFYERMLGFRACGPTRICPRVGAPAVLLWLDLEWGSKQIERYGGHKELAGRIRSLYPFFFSPEEEGHIVRRLKAIG